jgi:hypothetical protein
MLAFDLDAASISGTDTQQSQFRRTRTLANVNHYIAFDLNRTTRIAGLRRGRRLSQADDWRSKKPAERRWNRVVSSKTTTKA